MIWIFVLSVMASLTALAMAKAVEWLHREHDLVAKAATLLRAIGAIFVNVATSILEKRGLVRLSGCLHTKAEPKTAFSS